MQDLYTKLRIEPDAGEDHIVAAAEEQPELREFTAILLNPDRRAGYDRVRNTLNTIAELRFRLDLPTNDAWFRKHYPEHNRWRQHQRHIERMAAEADRRLASEPEVHSAPPKVRRAVAPELLVIGALLLIAGGFAGYLLYF